MRGNKKSLATRIVAKIIADRGLLILIVTNFLELNHKISEKANILNT